MNIHFVGGFLGSGKTTAISSACSLLMGQGEKVGVVTNDVGKYQVDSRFMNTLGIATAEVSGACICGRYDDFLERLDALVAKDRPRTVFVELIGSSVGMADLIRRSLHEDRNISAGKPTLTVFADFRLMAVWLSGAMLPFSDDIVYIFERQLGEADLLVLNKNDLLSQLACDEVLRKAERRFPNLNIVSLSFLKPNSARIWLSALEEGTSREGGKRFIAPLDPVRYSNAERSLTWLESELEIQGSEKYADDGIKECQQALAAFFEALWDAFMARSAEPGHVKALVHNYRNAGEGHVLKVGFSSGDIQCPIKEGNFASLRSSHIGVILNARVLSSPELLIDSIDEALRKLKGLSAVRVLEKGRLINSPSTEPVSSRSSLLSAQFYTQT